MSRFQPSRVAFGHPAARKAEGGAVTPHKARQAARRLACLHEAEGVLRVIPEPGESLHAVMTGFYDLMHLIAVLIGRLGRVERLRIATLSYNGRNLAEMRGLLAEGKVGRLALLTSCFFRDHNEELWETTLRELACDPRAGHKVAACRSHAKVVTLDCADGRKFSIEGSANLRTNRNQEQFALFHDAALHDWHAQWIDLMVDRHGTQDAGQQGEEG